MKAIEVTTKFFLSLVLVFALILAVFSLLLKWKLLNSGFYISKFSSFNYYTSVSENTMKALAVVARNNNIPKEILVPYGEEAWLRTEIDNYTKEFIKYITKQRASIEEINFSIPEKQFSERLSKFLKAEDLVINNQRQLALENVERQAKNTAVQNINIYDGKGHVTSEEFQAVRNNIARLYSCTYAYIFALLVTLLIVAYLKRAHRYKVLLWYGYSFSTAGALSTLVPLAIIKSRMLKKLPLEEVYIKKVITEVVQDFFSTVIIVGVIVFSIGIILVMSCYRKFESVY